MKVIRPSGASGSPRLSLILIDWTVRESFHILEYLQKQTAPRDSYEIILIEFYTKEHPEIIKRLGDAAPGSHPPVDQWCVMGFPAETMYHKHLLYNAGIALARGEIVCVLDSDAIAPANFCASVLSFLDRRKKTVLHFDELRNNNPKHYPFDFPDPESLSRDHSNCRNLGSDGRPEGLSNKSDPLHVPNYGACMAARREDLLAAGGADEHIDYAGHICGVYEMTFRLGNMGFREFWHPSVWLSHCWHPGADGSLDYNGPHDGRNMSSTALEALESRRVHPLCPNRRLSALKNNKILGSAAEAETFLSSMTAGLAEKWGRGRFAALRPRVWGEDERRVFSERYILSRTFGFDFYPLSLASLFERGLIAAPSGISAKPEFPAAALESLRAKGNLSRPERRFLAYLCALENPGPEPVGAVVNDARGAEECLFAGLLCFSRGMFDRAEEIIAKASSENSDAQLRECAGLLKIMKNHSARPDRCFPAGSANRRAIGKLAGRSRLKFWRDWPLYKKHAPWLEAVIKKAKRSLLFRLPALPRPR